MLTDIRCLVLFIMESYIGELLAAGAVDGVGKSRMIGIQFRAVRQDLIGEFVQIGDPSGKPRHRVISVDCNPFECQWVGVAAHEFSNENEMECISQRCRSSQVDWWPRWLDICQPECAEPVKCHQSANKCYRGSRVDCEWWSGSRANAGAIPRWRRWRSRRRHRSRRRTRKRPRRVSTASIQYAAGSPCTPVRHHTQQFFFISLIQQSSNGNGLRYGAIPWWTTGSYLDQTSFNLHSI